MPPKHEEITGIFLREDRRWDLTMMGQIDTSGVPVVAAAAGATGATTDLAADPFADNSNLFGPPAPTNNYHYLTIKGTADEDELEIGLTYRFYGRHVDHPRFGRQFHFQTFTIASPHGKRGITSYLQHCPGVGKAIAEALWKQYGTEAVATLRANPELAAAEIKNLSLEVANESAKFLSDHQALENCSIDLVELFAARGFPKRIVKEATKIWGNNAAAIIRRNPYLLMRFRGVGFLKCDALYLDLGLNPNKIKRQAYAIWYALAADTEGHTWHPVSVGVNAISQRVASAEINAPAALRLAKRSKIVGTYRDEPGNNLWIAEGKKSRQEESVARYVAQAIEELPLAHWPEIPGNTELSEHQLEHLNQAIGGGLIGILAGSPGTGKSFAAAVVIKEAIRVLGTDQVAVCAPTGKAAVRVTEAMERYSIPLKATTIHRLLGVESMESGAGWSFRHGEHKPLPYKLIVIDESSMISVDLMASFLAARGSGTHILFIGDPYQLPPVGHGAPLRDFIAAGLPCGELKEIRRNAGAIVRACAEIRDRSTFTGCPKLDLAAGDNLLIVDAHGPEKQIAQLDQLYSSIIKAGRRNPIWDVQVLVPVNARSPLARKTLNKHLQALLNPGGQCVAGNPFRVGDKIICTKNGFLPSEDINHPEANEDGKVAVANGEMGEVIDVQLKITTAKMTSPDRVVKIPRGAGDAAEVAKAADKKKEDAGDDANDTATPDTGCDWDLAYAISTHKSQGSEFPVTIVMIDEYSGARMVMSRNWLFTAISRAKECAILIGKHETALSACRRDAIGRRKTFLKERIVAVMKERELVQA